MKDFLKTLGLVTTISLSAFASVTAIPVKASQTDSALQELQASANKQRSGGWSEESIPNMQALQNSLYIYMKNLRAVDRQLSSDYKTADNWAEQLIKSYTLKKLPKSVDSLMSEALQNRKKLEAYAGTTAMRNIDQNLEPSAKVMQLKDYKHEYKIQSGVGDFNKIVPSGPPES